MEKRGLGRGLAALIPETGTDDRADIVREVPVGQITANPYQPRTLFDPIKQEDLVASIKEHGVLQPILVRRVGHDRYQLVAGERRFRAAQAAGLAAIPALIKECTEREQLEMAVVENVQREDIGVIEAARAYRRMIDEFGMTQETVAQRVGKSRSSVANTLRLLSLPEEILGSLERGEISEGHGRALMLAENDAAIYRTWQLLLKRQLSVRDTEKLAKELRAGGSPATSAKGPAETPGSRAGGHAREYDGSGSARDPNEAALLDELQTALRTRVSLRRTSGGAGRVEIEFYSAEDLERIVETILPGRGL